MINFEKVRENLLQEFIRDSEDILAWFVNSAEPMLYIYKDSSIILANGDPSPLHQDYILAIPLDRIQSELLEIYRDYIEAIDATDEESVFANFIKTYADSDTITELADMIMELVKDLLLNVL